MFYTEKFKNTEISKNNKNITAMNDMSEITSKK